MVIRNEEERQALRRRLAEGLERLHTPPEEFEATWAIDAIRQARLAEADLVMEIMEV